MPHKLLIVFYRDHERFYYGLQNFVLHIHSHFAELYRNHGSLSNINTFSQEDFMGFVSKSKHGTNYWADQLVFYVNVSFSYKPLLFCIKVINTSDFLDVLVLKKASFSEKSTYGTLTI
jgi:hypothetical protein